MQHIVTYFMKEKSNSSQQTVKLSIQSSLHVGAAIRLTTDPTAELPRLTQFICTPINATILIMA